jgi:hypothetical protein
MTQGAQEKLLFNKLENLELATVQSERPEEEVVTDLFDLSPFWEVISIKKSENSYEVFAELLTPPPISALSAGIVMHSDRTELYLKA